MKKFSQLIIEHTELWLTWNQINADINNPNLSWEERAQKCKLSEDTIVQLGLITNQINNVFITLMQDQENQRSLQS